MQTQISLNMYKIKTETLRDVKERQTLWLPWMQEICEGLSLDSLVETTTQMLPIGNYLVSIKLANRNTKQ
jgi:hypothetical protein